MTLLYYNEVYLPEVCDSNGDLSEPSGLLLDAFSGHFDKKVKEVTEPIELLHWLLMDGGITPKGQPLDALINKVYKGGFRDYFEEWSLNAPINPKTDHPLPPSRQLLAQWAVKAWAKIPEELIRKAWEVCGYKSTEELQSESTSYAIVNHSQQKLGSLVEKIAGQEAGDAFRDDENEPWSLFPENEDEPWGGMEHDNNTEDEEESDESTNDFEDSSDSEE